jgi:hypothetical protein
MSQGAETPLSSITGSLVIDGRPIDDWTASEARKTARRKIAEGEVLAAFAKAIEAAKRLDGFK